MTVTASGGPAVSARTTGDNRGMSRTDQLPATCEVAVVGGGIVGLAVARELLRRHSDLELCLLEAEDRLAAHQSSHNSGVIHAGVYYEPGSLRARLCVEGALMMESFLIEHGLPWRHAGKLVVATDERELPRLDELERRARANGVRGLVRVGPDGIEAIEPGAQGLAALHSPFTGVTDFGEVAAALGDEVERLGGEIRTSAAITAVTDSTVAHPPPRSPTGGGGAVLQTARGTLRAGTAVFCAGLQSDRVAQMAGGAPEPHIVPIRGSYLKVRPKREPVVRGNLYPVPDPDLPFLGAHLTRTIDGSLLIGPTALMVAARDAYRLTRMNGRDLADAARWPGTWKLIARHPGAVADELANSICPNRLVRQAARMLPGLKAKDVTRGPAGVRAQALGRDGRLIEDFLIEQTETGLHIRNAPSPAATSAFALAKLIADQVLA